MMHALSQIAGYWIIVVFGVAMILLTYFASRSERWMSSGTGFLVAWRDVSWPLAAPSIAASWIWAPALFVSVQKAYELGLPGIFWFTAPNILALVVFAFLAPRIRSVIPGGYTLPDWIRYRLGSETVHKVYMVPYIWYQVMAVTVQIFVGGLMLNYLTGISLNLLMILLLVICLIYSLISGLRASVVTDFVQMVFIIAGVVIIPPWVAEKVGLDAVSKGLGGLAGNTNIFDPHVAFSFGIVTSIGLIAGSISDQQYWQRAFAIRPTHLVPSYVVAGILFGVVPILLSILGFVAANPDMKIALAEGIGLPMIGIEVVVRILPLWAAVFFVVMLLSGLMSTLDSAMCAASSLYAIDLAPLSQAQRDVLAKERIGIKLTEGDQRIKDQLDKETVHRARVGMYIISILGLILAFIVQHLFSLDRLWWIFNGVASCFVVPTVLSLYYDRLSAKGVVAGICGAGLGMIAFVYGNWVQNDQITVFSAVFIVAVSLVCCLSFRNEKPWLRENARGVQSSVTA
jgi:Na+/proline symporter